jgi:glycerol-3-phosphate O-acyltransferase / dihydroxyacetone phosphate acyltransferase
MKCISMCTSDCKRAVALRFIQKVCAHISVTCWGLSRTVGGSHDRTDLLPFKAGFAMMALGAMASHPDVNVKIVPVGLSYFHAHRFRSRAVIEFGSPLEIPSDLVEKYQNGGPEKREAVSKLLHQVYDALKAVTVRAPDYDTLMVRNNLRFCCL